MKKFTVCLLIGAMAASMLTPAVEAVVEALILQTQKQTAVQKQ